MLRFAAVIHALGAFGLRLLFATFDVSHLCNFPWTSDAGRAGAHPYHRYGIAQSNLASSLYNQFTAECDVNYHARYAVWARTGRLRCK